jgi:hypothetical protein
VRLGTLASYAAAARLGHISRARVSQIVSLLNLNRSDHGAYRSVALLRIVGAPPFAQPIAAIQAKPW